MISESLPYWPIVPDLSPSPWYTFQLDLVRASGLSCRRRACGERASRWHWRRSPHPARTPGGWSGGLCGQHDRRHRRRPGIQPGVGPRDRHGPCRAGADRACRGGRAGRPFAPASGERPNGAPGGRGGADSRDGSGWLARLERDAGAVGTGGVRPADAKLAHAVGPRHRQGSPRWARRAGRLLHVRRRGDERLRRRHHDEGGRAQLPRRRQDPGVDAARRHAAAAHAGAHPGTLAQEARVGTGRRLRRGRHRRHASSCTPTSSGSSSATSSRWCRPP